MPACSADATDCRSRLDSRRIRRCAIAEQPDGTGASRRRSRHRSLVAVVVGDAAPVRGCDVVGPRSRRSAVGPAPWQLVPTDTKSPRSPAILGSCGLTTCDASERVPPDAALGFESGRQAHIVGAFGRMRSRTRRRCSSPVTRDTSQRSDVLEKRHAYLVVTPVQRVARGSHRRRRRCRRTPQCGPRQGQVRAVVFAARSG